MGNEMENTTEDQIEAGVIEGFVRIITHIVVPYSV